MMSSILLDLKIVAADGKTIKLKTEAGHHFHWPTDLMPRPCSPGDTVCFDPLTLSTEGLSPEARFSAARAIVNELLGGKPPLNVG